MSKIKVDLMKQIEQAVARKKQLSKEVSKEKTIARWVSDFFTEYEKVSRLDSSSYNVFVMLACNKLKIQLRNLDRKCELSLKDENKTDVIVEIHWSPQYAQANNCEEIMVFDASTAHFQCAIEQI